MTAAAHPMPRQKLTPSALVEQLDGIRPSELPDHGQPQIVNQGRDRSIPYLLALVALDPMETVAPECLI